MFLGWIFVFLVATNCSFVALGNNFLYIYNCIMFPSLPVSTLYATVIMALFDDVFRFAVIMEWLVLKLMELICTMSMWCSFSWSTSCSILWTVLLFALLHPFQKCFILLHFMHFFPYAGHDLCWWLESEYLHFYLVSILNSCVQFYPILLLIIS